MNKYIYQASARLLYHCNNCDMNTSTPYGSGVLYDSPAPQYSDDRRKYRLADR